ncbi:fungal-specific transcription factor domain-containing protein [Hypoxylon trugodes]|uniref:fungal-specific transcription factor domain-containing protein n=1 Tax=Hypoxylon trugodes TaxID=326681 RepID=UPI00219D77FE|nr:fungal-specific transcription factor domain-containing protein [Hypoxylon trugodes]KAI1385497.1 fungal-specific transcription factor domain-containing protein [Hypoxylon trugodes]
MSQVSSHSRRRDKPILSCTFCRGRKLRCDRQSPCGACTRRGKPVECVYSCSEQERKDAIDYRPRATRSQQARQRIARLESLVTEMRDMAQQNSRQRLKEGIQPQSTHNSSDPSLTPPDNHVVDNMGKLSLTENHTIYTGSSHWVTILEDIRRLKDELSQEYPENPTNPEPDSGPSPRHPATKISLLNSAHRLPREQILARMPPRKVVDRHVSQFFNTFDMGRFILPRNKFFYEYGNFWDNPSNVPIMWVGLLFGIMSVSAFLKQQDANTLGIYPAEAQDTLEAYRASTIHCLVAGDYLRPGKYTIETLILLFTVDQNVNVDTSIGNWVLIGVIIRLALRMGLHRDPSHWQDIRPLQAEIRRRIWITLYQMDFFTSTQVALPRIIKDSQCDARPPIHLFDQDLGLDNDEIPPERPLTEHTPLLYIIHRHPVIKVAAEIYDATEAGPPSSATIAELSAKLRNTVDAIPPSLRYKSIETSVVDTPATVLHQMILNILINKAIYLLHRRSFMKGPTGEETAKSNELCIEAALEILEHHRRMNEEIQPGGLMFGIRWKVSSSLNHEFLQATMMLCLALGRFNEENAETANSRTLYRQDDIIQALEFVAGIWEKNAERSTEARRALKAIATVLHRDVDTSNPPDSAPSDALFDHMPGLSAQSYFESFDYGQNVGLDPSFFTVNDSDVMGFGCMPNDFSTDQQLNL